MESYQKEGGGGEWGKCTGNKKHNWQIQNRQEEVKNGIGNGEAKELICTTHIHELRGWNAGGRDGCKAEVDKGEKKRLDDCYSIINKIYLKQQIFYYIYIAIIKR